MTLKKTKIAVFETETVTSDGPPLAPMLQYRYTLPIRMRTAMQDLKLGPVSWLGHSGEVSFVSFRWRSAAEQVDDSRGLQQPVLFGNKHRQGLRVFAGNGRDVHLASYSAS